MVVSNPITKCAFESKTRYAEIKTKSPILNCSKILIIFEFIQIHSKFHQKIQYM